MQQVGDDWMVAMEWPAGRTDGGPWKLTIEAIDKVPPGGLSSTVLRQIDFRSAIEKLRAEVERDLKRAGENDRLRREMQEAQREQLRAALNDGITPQYLALLSWHYVTAVDRGQANINDYLAEMLGKPVGTVRGHLIRARRDGLLSGSHGRKGGELSPEAMEMVEPFADALIAELDMRDLARRQAGRASHRSP